MENSSSIQLYKFSTKLGDMYAGSFAEKLVLLEFTDRKNLQAEFQDLKKKYQTEIVEETNDLHCETEKQVKEYFNGERKSFDLPLETPGTKFQNSVWQTLKKIPYGETWTYTDQANEMGQPKAVRAVASANGMNRIAIVIPCHRVIGSNGSLTGYAAGVHRKKALLELEQNRL